MMLWWILEQCVHLCVREKSFVCHGSYIVLFLSCVPTHTSTHTHIHRSLYPGESILNPNCLCIYWEVKGPETVNQVNNSQSLKLFQCNLLNEWGREGAQRFYVVVQHADFFSRFLFGHETDMSVDLYQSEFMYVNWRNGSIIMQGHAECIDAALKNIPFLCFQVAQMPDRLWPRNKWCNDWILQAKVINNIQWISEVTAFSPFNLYCSWPLIMWATCHEFLAVDHTPWIPSICSESHIKVSGRHFEWHCFHPTTDRRRQERNAVLMKSSGPHPLVLPISLKTQKGHLYR